MPPLKYSAPSMICAWALPLSTCFCSRRDHSAVVEAGARQSGRRLSCWLHLTWQTV
eukprot:CAMPEP_0184086928 /NCGR_PEP_ID=MMETSP0974-20121125/5459_1 /TAXON_ID=483370 /ORGANISM="non described non described, Strain CCMP2097" /LENGTH=55 /DNA_ID=CAMNT_0026389619 /DNA_START=263 /DNA_END=427 /DNA_ORIENTATION=-